MATVVSAVGAVNGVPVLCFFPPYFAFLSSHYRSISRLCRPFNCLFYSFYRLSNFWVLLQVGEQNGKRMNLQTVNSFLKDMKSVVLLQSCGAVVKKRASLLQWNLNGSKPAAASLPSSAFLGNTLKKVTSKISHRKVSPKNFKVVAEYDESKKTSKDRWKGLAYDESDDQQDITRGKGMVDTLFQAPMGTGTHHAIMSSYDYISQGLRVYNLDNTMDGFYIAPAFMDKVVVHITKNFLSLPNIKVPLILGIWGGKGQGKSFQCELVFAKMGINPIMMSAGELESGNAGEPAKLIRQRYREAADIIRKGKMCCLFINDLDAGAGRMGGTTQYTVNNQMVNATLMNIADNPTNVQLPGMYNKEENPRVPIIVTGNDFSTLYAPLIRDGRMEKFYWAPTREDRIGVCSGIFKTDRVPHEDIVKLVDTFPGQSIDFFSALRARVYDDEVREWVSEVGVQNVGKRLVNSKEGPPTFEQPKMTLEKLLEYGNMLVQEQENVKRVQLADKYLKEAALGDANDDAIKNESFYGKAAQQVNLPVPEGRTDPSATNFDPTARSDDGSCVYNFFFLIRIFIDQDRESL
ncbi:PREDICTED: ribulose bisphosphate carboxylase/oxygenase activase 2, chloroplastic-like [Theobroma cacao]|uniref:Ribulose bisphosphate carboxylase/oxygenase activase, chloroplastic n=1 Tax=Theobroma cacao TaxID=3641 RepID=A0AB32W9W7_THECC|nr:PREDICTED: ribulose bisphosphate carboxylase/oxygenase activase 2, chloroplastic-like [Theobroma cacao]